MNRPISYAVMTGVLASVAVVGFTQGMPSTAVRIDSGIVRGARDGDVVAFKGIPFAAPPVGPLRWRAPRPATPWARVLAADHYGHDCMQKPFPSDAAPLGTPPAEDCLYANVWRPAKTGKALPVMIWIYGGGFVNGGASPPTYSGAALARQGIMVVSFNYRLGRFGSFAHPQLTRADADRGLLVNYGYMDQIAALHWVKRNIARFGGDPANVTIVGESAGGMSVHMLLTSPMTTGMFQRAVIMSGGPTDRGDSLASAERTGIAFAQTRGIATDDPDALAKLRALSAEQVTDGLNLTALFAPTPGPKTYEGPIPDGRIARDALTAYRTGRFARVPVMVGATSDDIGGSDGAMAAGAARTANLIASRGIPVYRYRFSYVADSARTSSPNGAGHATDIPFFFHTEDIKYGAQTTARDRQAGALASGYLVNFVRTGNPNGGELPAWPRVSTTAPVIDFTSDGSAKVIAGPTP